MAELKRALGLPALVFYGVGVILGAGIYSILGQAAGEAGKALWLSLLLASLAAALTALSYAELATMFPRAGADYVYLRNAWPERRGLAGSVGWALVASRAATVATVALAFAGYARLFFEAPAWLVAGLLIVISAGVNLAGIRQASWANILFTLIEAGGLVALVVVGIREPAFAQAFLAAPHAGVLAGAGLIFFAFLGFEDIANLAEEAKRPGRDLPRAILLALAISTLLYILVAVASVALLDPERLAASSSPLAEAVREAAPALAGALGGIALFATANTALIALLAASRFLVGMGREGDAPAAFARTLERRKTPAYGIAFATVAALAFLPLGGVGVVGSIASLLALLAFAMTNVALARLRYLMPERERPFRVPIAIGRFPVLPALGVAAILVLLVQFEPVVYAVGAGVLGAGALARAASARAHARRG